MMFTEARQSAPCTLHARCRGRGGGSTNPLLESTEDPDGAGFGVGELQSPEGRRRILRFEPQKPQRRISVWRGRTSAPSGGGHFLFPRFLVTRSASGGHDMKRKRRERSGRCSRREAPRRGSGERGRGPAGSPDAQGSLLDPPLRAHGRMAAAAPGRQAEVRARTRAPPGPRGGGS